MIDSPALNSFIELRLQPCRVLLDGDGKVRALDGAAETYGLGHLACGDNGVAALPFLHGLAVDEVMELPLLEMPSGARANVIVSARADGIEVLLLDASYEWGQQREVQQKANELHLLSDQQRRLLARLEKTQAELRESRDEAEQASRLKSEFIARMSHEFRTPLTSVIGYARRLNSMPQPPAGVGSIERSAVHLLNLVENLLDEAQLRSGKILIQPRPSAIRELLDEVCGYFYPLAQDKGLLFELAPLDQLPACVALDDLRLRQVLINLLGNAVKYTEQGTVQLVASWQDGRLCLTIADQGPGIAAAAQEKIFSAFWRASHNAPGAGLGLSISRSLVELMGGDLSLESAPGHGTSVHISLPAALATRVAAPSARTLTILLAEDNNDVAELLEVTLEEAGYRMIHCQSGSETLSRIGECAPDLLIVDRNLNDMDGFTLTRQLRADGLTRPVVMLTASNLLSDAEQAHAAGCDDFLIKSAGVGPLLESVNRLLGESPGRVSQHGG